MRYYKLSIQGGITFELSETNPCAPRIVFNIASYSKASLYTPSIITLYNVSTDFFTNSQYFINKTITLEAGIKSSILSNKAGLTESLNNTIYIGVINRVVPNFTGIDTSVSFYVTNFKTNTTTKYTETLNRGDIVAEKMKSLLTSVFDGLNYVVAIDEGATSIVSENTASVPLIASTFQDVVSLLEKYNLELSIEQNTCTIYSNDNITTKSTFEPSAHDFLTQPSWETVARISCVFSLRGGLRRLQILKMPGNLVMNLAPLLQGNQSLAGVTYKNALITGGEFLITTIWHRGDSRNIDPESWSTTVEATKQGVNLATGESLT